VCNITRASIDVNKQSARRSLNGVVYIILYLPDENWDHYRQVAGKSQAVTLDVTELSLNQHERTKPRSAISPSRSSVSQPPNVCGAVPGAGQIVGRYATPR
jgi:hypothetical protein